MREEISMTANGLEELAEPVILCGLHSLLSRTWRIPNAWDISFIG